ncbi:McrC family protein [Mongoliibacter ruber]|uniref:5-methylcytosine-specific restriction enzyme subunit McrC n=1 Tax=Mongoliibacter ruber TaxID=1750599 RepID=A0A2T0WDU9_9BACT|nr:LlaJI family restriction endonuclease [Mongoliibacter ruber]PRY84872.1 5-methylcytosine-specific restriction enzyme subunit McrC [Mongoliibacter ruber]
MNSLRNHITVFEHQSIKLDQEFPNNGKFDTDVLKSCQRFYGEKGIPYFDLIHNGIRFKEFVGVIQVGNTLIEVLPKADKKKPSLGDEFKWQRILLGMLKAVHGFDVQTPSSSSLNLKSNTILDLYFELFIIEVEYLLHSGLIKKYRKVNGNVNALKGSLQFGKHIQYNLVHQERFFVKHTVYDVSHTLHYILYKTLHLLKLLNTNSRLHSRIGALLLHFPEMPDIKISEATFEKIILDRKTQRYQKAMQISRLLLLHYHPDLSKGRNHVLALMFDMNELWEQFVAVSLRKQKGFKVHTQRRKYFWSPSKGPRRTIRPDILIEANDGNYVLDTKWKLLTDNRPSVEDIRQMYAYHHYFEAEKVALVYPGELEDISGKYVEINQSKDSSIECSLIFLPVGEDVKKWQEGIIDRIGEWVGTPQLS